MNHYRTIFCRLTVFVAFCVVSSSLDAADVRVIYPGFDPEISGKEVDWIYGDYLMKNDQITVVIAAPIATRDANLTVRNIGASILDLSLNEPSNDQLSALYSDDGKLPVSGPFGRRNGTR